MHTRARTCVSHEYVHEGATIGQKSVGFPAARVAGSCEPSDMGAGN